MDTVEAWHFLRQDGCLNYPPHTKVEAGMTFRLPDGKKPVLCARGWHGSVRAIDALSHAPGEIICRVRLGGEIVRGDDKLVASERTVLWMADATNTLHECACLFAEEALRVARVDDPRCAAAIQAKRRWLRGEITDQQLAAARAAAMDAAWDAAGAAAWDAARDAARAAARDAARAAAWAAAGAAAWAAAGAAARDAQNTILEREFMKLRGAA